MELYGLKKLSPTCKDLHEACPYSIEKVIQKGRNAVRLLKASVSESNEIVAIKLFPKNKDGSALCSFQSEKKFLSGFSHDHILNYLEIYQDAVIEIESGKFIEYSAIVMDYVPYGDLFGVIAQKSFAEKLARTIFKQMVSAICYLHLQDLAHLDLKLENFLVDPKQGIKLIDFECCQKTNNGVKPEAKGTPGYRAPEAIIGNWENTKALDIYSLGVVLFTLVAGTPPYTEKQENGIWKFDKYYEALRNDTKKFWSVHEKYRNAEGKDNFSTEFKETVEVMLNVDPKIRPSVEEIKRLKWYQGDVYNKEELDRQLRQYFRAEVKDH